jgi:hypothetical protein
MKSLKSIFIVILILGAQSIRAQKTISNQNHAWVTYLGNHSLSDKISLHTEYQWRRADGFNNWQQSLTRIGVDYHLLPNLSVTAGYGWIVTYPYGEQPIAHQINEHRIWQQVNAKVKYGRFELQHRYRLEQRFLENYIKNPDGTFTRGTDLFRQRVRYRAMVLVPLSRKEMLDNTLFLNVNNELFLGFGKGIGKKILDQNRFNLALGWRFNKDLNVQVGYLNQFVVKSDGIKAERNHTLLISTIYNIDFTKKKKSI